MPLMLPASGGATGTANVGDPNPFAPAGGIPNFNSDALNRFTPVVYSPLMVEQFYAATVCGEICNTRYEGEISGYGDKIIIRTSPDVVIDTEYRPGKDLNYQYPDSVAIEMLIDQSYAFALGIDRIQQHQSDIDYMSDFVESAGLQMAEEIDTTVLSIIGAQASAATSGATAGADTQSFDMGVTGTPVVLDKANIIDFFADVATVFDESNVPDDGSRAIVIPPIIANRIEKSDLQHANEAGDDTSIARTRMLGEIAGLNIYKSNLLARTGTGAATEFNLIACHESAISFAAQIDDKQFDTFRNPNSFGELTRGLMVWGVKVIKDDAIISIFAQAA